MERQRSRSEVLSGVQSLRFLAASMVLILHSTFYLHERGVIAFDLWRPGYYGVHIFFVISGFVMMRCAARLHERQQTWMDFIRARAVRIVPLYWIVTSVKLLVVLVAPVALSISIVPEHVAASYLFLPARAPSGSITPFYGVGWTLQFEALFYVLFALALWRRRDPLTWVTASLVVLAALSLVKTPNWPAAAFYCDPIVLNFVWGMVICRVMDRGFRLSPVPAVGLMAAGMATILIAPGTSILGAQFAAIVLAVIQLEPILAHRLPHVLVRGGAASYALYLCHPLIGPALIGASITVGIGSGLAIAIAWVGSVAAAFFVYEHIERPLYRWLNREGRPRSAFILAHQGRTSL